MKLTKAMAGINAASTILSLAACSSNNSSTADNSSAGTSGEPDSYSAAARSSADASSSAADSNTKTTDGLTLKVLTHRTDRIEDGSLAEMTKAFEEANNCKVEYQGFTDYASDVSTMMNTTDYGDVLMIPDSVKVMHFGNFFESL